MALNADQARAVAVRDGLCVVIAGPGTGKTETLAAKTAALIEAGERPLVVTFTRSAAHTVIHRLGALRRAATIGTCHSLAFRVLRRVSSPPPSAKRLLQTGRKNEFCAAWSSTADSDRTLWRSRSASRVSKRALLSPTMIGTS